MLIINQSQVVDALPMGACIDLMGDTLAALARGEAVQPLRTHIVMPDRSGVLGMMPAHLGPAHALGIKVLTVFHGNQGTVYDSHQGVVLLFEEEHGSLLALMDATAITAIRTAAVSGLATRLLALPEANDLAILGAGTQALTHLEAMLLVRPVKRVRLWNRSRENAVKLAGIAKTQWGIEAEVSESVADALAGADLICTTTGAAEPIVRSDWIRPGAHLNVVGSSVARHREVDSATVAKARVFVDRMESALNEPGDLLIPIREGAITERHILAELGDVILGRHPGRGSADEVTMFKSQGIAVEDVAAARFIYDRARLSGIGTEIHLGGTTHIELFTTGKRSR